MRKLITLLIALLWAGSLWAGNVQIGSGTTTGSYFPIYSCYGFNYSQQIYLGSEIATAGGGSGNISKIRFYYNAGGTSYSTWNNWTVYIGTTAKTSFASTTDWVPVAEMTQVFSGNISTPVAGTWLEIILTTPFAYTSGSNIVVAIDENTPSYSCTAAWRNFASGSNRGILFYDDDIDPDPAAPPTANYGPNANIAQIQLDMPVVLPMLSGTPSILDFGYVNAGVPTASKSYTLTGENLSAGPVVVTAPAGYEVSLDNVTFTSSVNISYSPPTLSATTVYVRLNPPTGNTLYSGNVTNVGGGASGNVQVSGTTFCDPVTTFSENFDAVTTPAFPSCWRKVGTAGTANTQATSAYSTPNCLYIYGYSGAKPVVAMPPVSNAGAGTHQLKFWLRGNFTAGDAIEVGYLTDPNSDASFVPVSSVVASSLTYTEQTVLLGTAPGAYTTIAFRHSAALGYSCLIDNVVWEPKPACIPPSALNATNITGFTAQLGWTELGTATSWDIEWGPTPFTPTGTPTLTGVTNPYLLTGLTPVTGYAYYVRSNCGGGVYSTWSGPKTFTTDVACPAPTALTATAITTTSATLGWTSMGTLFDIEWMLSTATATGTPNITGVANPYVLTGLSPSNTYKYYVRQDCGVNGTSLWAGPYTFSTLCDVFVPYFAQDFQGTTFPPTCWSRGTGQLATPVTLTSTTSNWTQDDWRNVVTGDKAARLNIWSTGLYGWLFTPQINLGAGAVSYQLDFDLTLNAYGTSNPPATTGVDDKFAVVISTDGGVTWSAANTLRLWDNAGSAYVYNNINPAGEHISLSLTGYTGTVMIGFYGESTVSNADNDLMVNNVIIDVLPACSKPTDLITNNIGLNQAFLDWTDNATATQWDIEWGPAGFLFGTGTRISATDMKPYKLTGLNPGTNYGFYVRALCPGGGYSAWSGPATFTTSVSCPSPTLLSASNIQPTSADLDWRENGSALEWQIQWGPAGFTLGTGTKISGITMKPYTLSGLTSSTNYGFYVRSVCGVGDTSLWVGPVTFRTPCESVSLPFTENFSGAAIPACWNQSYAAPLTSNRWSISTTNMAGGAVNEIRAGWQSGSAISRLITPPINTSGATMLALSFRQLFDDYGAGITYKIQSSSDGTTWTDESWVYASGSGNAGPELVTTNIVNNLGGTTYIAWVLDGDHYQFDNWYVDNVSIAIPLAHDVSTVGINMAALYNAETIIPKATVGNLGLNTETFPVTMTIGTYTSTKTVTALAPGATTQVSFDPWDAQVGTYTVNVCTGLTTDMDITNDCKTINTSVEVLTKFFSYNTFTSEVGYFFKEHPDAWVPLAAATSFDFIGAGTWANGIWYGSEYYDATALTGGGWYTIDPTTGVMTKIADLGIGFAGITYNPYTNTMYGVNWNGTTSDLYSITPATGAHTLLGSVGSGELLINLANNGSGYLYGLGISSDHLFRINPDSLTIADIGATGQALNYAQDMEYDFSTGTMYAAAYTSTGSLYTVNLSTGLMTLVGGFAGGAEMCGFAIPFCGSIPTSVVTSNVTSTSATIDWTDSGSPVKWDIEFGPTGFTHGTGNIITGVTAKPYLLNGLMAGLTYDVYVRGYCEFSKSAWSQVATFTTCATISAYPYSQNFDAVTVPEIPNCWTKYSSASGKPWVSANASSGFLPHSAPNFMYVEYDELLPKNEWLVTPGFEVTAGNTYTVKFWVVAPGYTPDPEKLKLVVSDDPSLSGVTAGTLLWDLNNQFLADYTEVTANYTATETGVVFFAWHAYSDANLDYIGLDDITITEAVPSCLEPTGVTASAVGVTTATLSWSAPTPAPGSGYEYEVRTSGAAGSGAVGLAVSGSTGAGVTTANISGLTGSTLYHVYLRSNCGDNVFSPWTVDYQFTTLAPVAVNGTVLLASCPGECDGSITTIVTGGVGPYAYSWTGPYGFASTSANISQLCAGTYYLTVTDANLVTATGNWMIAEPSEISAMGSAVNASCPTAADGSIQLSVVGGTPGYTFLWSTGATTQNLTNVLPGNYYVTVTDQNGCYTMTMGMVSYANPVCANVSVAGVYTTTECFDALNTITVAGLPEVFEVSGAGDVTFIAGAKILFLPGTKVTAPGYMHGYIAPSGPFCSATKLTEVTPKTGETPFATERTWFTLYPNPTNGDFTLVQKGEQAYNEVRIEVFSMSGERVLTESMVGAKHEFRFSNMPTGLYFVKVVAEGYVETIKLVKTR